MQCPDCGNLRHEGDCGEPLKAAGAEATPGPWVFAGGDSAPILHIYAPDGKHLFHKDRSLEEQEANARLMAASQDLLAFARVAIEWAERETEYDGRTYTICNSCSGQDGEHRKGCKLPEYFAAIAKAQAA